MEQVASYDNIKDMHAQLTRSEEDYTKKINKFEDLDQMFISDLLFVTYITL